PGIVPRQRADRALYEYGAEHVIGHSPPRSSIPSGSSSRATPPRTSRVGTAPTVTITESSSGQNVRTQIQRREDQAGWRGDLTIARRWSTGGSARLLLTIGSTPPPHHPDAASHCRDQADHMHEAPEKRHVWRPPTGPERHNDRGREQDDRPS